MKRFIFVFLAGIIGSMGLGAGTVLIIYLTVFEGFPQTKAQGINLLFFLPCAAYSIFCYSKSGMIVKKPLLKLIISGLIGAAAGYTLLSFTPTEYLSKAFGIFLILLGIKELLSFKRKPTEN